MFEDKDCVYFKLVDGKLCAIGDDEQAKIHEVLEETNKEALSLMEEAKNCLGAIDYELSSDFSEAMFTVYNNLYKESYVVYFDGENRNVSVCKGGMYSITEDSDFLLKDAKRGFFENFLEILEAGKEETVIDSESAKKRYYINFGLDSRVSKADVELFRRIYKCLEVWQWESERD